MIEDLVWEVGVEGGQKILNHMWTHWNTTPGGKIYQQLFFFNSLSLLPPSLSLYLSFQKSSISLDIFYFLFKAMFQVIPRLICTKMLSIITSQITLYILRVISGLNKRQDFKHGIIQNHLFIHFFLFFSFVPCSKKDRKRREIPSLFICEMMPFSYR